LFIVQALYSLLDRPTTVGGFSWECFLLSRSIELEKHAVQIHLKVEKAGIAACSTPFFTRKYSEAVTLLEITLVSLIMTPDMLSISFDNATRISLFR
jgi:hypothetical protein